MVFVKNNVEIDTMEPNIVTTIKGFLTETFHKLDSGEFDNEKVVQAVKSLLDDDSPIHSYDHCVLIKVRSVIPS